MEVGEAGVVWINSDPNSSLTVDGEDDAWSFTFQRSPSEQLSASVDVSGARVTASEGSCPLEASIEVLDSRRIVPDAIHRFERRFGTFEHGLGNVLFLHQDACALSARPESHHVMIAAHDATHYVRYWDDGTFIDLIGPCESPNLEDCLTGHALEVPAEQE
jgi:hypothetical protein